MKKIILFFLAVMAVWLTGCSAQEKSYQSYIDDILELDSVSYSEETIFNHKNIVSLVSEKSLNPNAIAKREIKIGNQIYRFNYVETITYSVGETVDSYQLDGIEEKKRILLTKDGEIRSILFEFARIEIESDADVDEVLTKLKPILEELVDLSGYKHIDETGNIDDNGIGRFGMYDYLFYNEINGYISDFCKVSVTGNGEVLGFSKIQLDAEKMNLQLNIDEKWEDTLISEKLKDMFTTSETEYISYKTSFIPQIVQYEGELYIQYWVSARYTYLTSERSSGLFGLLIPVRLLCDRTTSCGT